MVAVASRTLEVGETDDLPHIRDEVTPQVLDKFVGEDYLSDGGANHDDAAWYLHAVVSESPPSSDGHGSHANTQPASAASDNNSTSGGERGQFFFHAGC